MANILGVKIDELNFKQVLRKITDFCVGSRLHQIVTVNPEFVVVAQKDKQFKDILNSADLSIPDGFGLKFGAWVFGQKIEERITGVDLTWEIAKLASERGFSVYFLGGKRGVADMAAKRIQLMHPGLKIAGTSSKDPDDKTIIDDIKSAKPDILLVAYGAPKQDKFIYELKSPALSSQFSSLRVAMGVGGTFDYIAEVVPRAPKWMRTIGMEWLYRLIKQPKRISRIFTAVVRFPLAVLWNKFQGK